MDRIDFSRLQAGIQGLDPVLAALQSRVETYNNQAAGSDGTGIDCPICKNKGNIAFIGETGSFTVRPCQCSASRRTVLRLQRQGLAERAARQTLERFRADTRLRRTMKETVEAFLRDPEPHWLAICGQSGVGKTHLCTAAFAALSFSRGLEGRYLTWNADARRIKTAAVNGDDGLLTACKTCQLLYIDDLFKMKPGTEPTDADVRLAFELLDWRYNRRLVTILSTECQLEDLRELDFALYRRITEMCGPYKINIAPDRSKCFAEA